MWPNPQETADLVTFTGEIFNGKRHFLCSAAENIRSFGPVLAELECQNDPEFTENSIKDSKSAFRRISKPYNIFNVISS